MYVYYIFPATLLSSTSGALTYPPYRTTYLYCMYISFIYILYLISTKLSVIHTLSVLVLPTVPHCFNAVRKKYFPDFVDLWAILYSQLHIINNGHFSKDFNASYLFICL